MLEFNITAGIIASKKDVKGNAPIYIFIYKSSVLICKKSIKYKVPVSMWLSELKRVNRKFPNAILINGIIDNEIKDFQKRVLEEKFLKGNIDIAELVNRDKIRDMDFFEFAEKQIKEKNYAVETRRNYSVYLGKIKAYQSKLKVSEISFPFLQGYESYLRDILHNEPNTIWGNMKFINTMTNDALKAKYITTDPFKVYKRPSYKQTTRIYLTASEIEKIQQFVKQGDTADLTHVAKHFLFMCFNGLRFSDAVRFSISKHIVDGERIVLETQKTGKLTNLYINDKIHPLAEYVDSNRLVITQTDFNRKLKLIAAHCSIKKKISSHVARHTFGSSLVTLGVSERVAQGLLAHGCAASTKIYYHLQNASLDEAMKKFDIQNTVTALT